MSWQYESKCDGDDGGLDWHFIVAAANMTRRQASALWPNLIDSTDG
jgi:hypothetical protein